MVIVRQQWDSTTHLQTVLSEYTEQSQTGIQHSVPHNKALSTECNRAASTLQSIYSPHSKFIASLMHLKNHQLRYHISQEWIDQKNNSLHCLDWIYVKFEPGRLIRSWDIWSRSWLFLRCKRSDPINFEWREYLIIIRSGIYFMRLICKTSSVGCCLGFLVSKYIPGPVKLFFLDE